MLPALAVAADAMELGLGVHGEAGVASMPLSNARFFLNAHQLHCHDCFFMRYLTSFVAIEIGFSMEFEAPGHAVGLAVPPVSMRLP